LPHIDIFLIGKALVFQFLPLLPIGFFLLGIIGIVLFGIGLQGGAPSYVLLVFLFCAVLFIYLAISILYRVEINDKGIRFTGFMKNKTINWENITNVKGGFGGILLIDQNSNFFYKIHMLITGYPDVIRILRLKRPDLWSPKENQLFKKHVTPTLLSILVGSPFLLIGLSNMSRGGKDYFWGGVITLGWGILFVAIGLGQLGSIELNNGFLVIRNNIEHRRLAANQIRQIDLQRIASIHVHGAAIHQFIVIVPVKGKAFRLSGFKDGDEVVYNFLFRWWEKYRKIN
jgi:hypothetical protein